MTSGTAANPWGDVPDDGDVRVFTRVSPYRTSENRNNKRHHYISVTYMNGFLCRPNRVWAYRLDDPTDPHAVRPAAIGFETYYYSQPLPDGSRENHRFEDLWNSVESVWEATMRAVRNRRLSPAISMNLLGMAALMRVRVPAARERNAVLIAAELRRGVKVDEALGRLAPELADYAGRLDDAPVGVNPHYTLLMMNDEFVAFGDLAFTLGFEVLHNTTRLPFITSDNPVCIYDPTVSPEGRLPYVHGDDVELLFPLDARTVLRGSRRLKPFNEVVRHRTLGDRQAVKAVNRTVAQFSYSRVLASDRSCDALVTAYAGAVPTVAVEERGPPTALEVVSRPVFGPRPKLSPFIDVSKKPREPDPPAGPGQTPATIPPTKVAKITDAVRDQTPSAGK